MTISSKITGSPQANTRAQSVPRTRSSIRATPLLTGLPIPTKTQATVTPPNPIPVHRMSKLLLNPYDAKLNLSSKDDRKLYHDACKGLSENKFDGKEEHFQSFIKLMVFSSSPSKPNK